MTSPLEGPNPLRPYYVPPRIGDPLSIASANVTKPGPNSTSTSTPISSNISSFSILPDLDYSGYVSDGSPSVIEVFKGLLDEALWKYTSILLAHPFDVAKTILQVYDENAVKDGAARGHVKATFDEDVFTQAPSDSDPDELTYFTSTTPHSLSYRPPSSLRTTSRSNRAPSPPPTSPHTLSIPTPAILQVISQLWTHSGAFGVWAGANTSFVHSILTRTLTPFFSSLLSALFALPSSSTTLPLSATGASPSLIDAAYPFATLSIAIAAAGLVAVITAPIDIVRTRLMLTPPSHPPRSLLRSLLALPSWSCPINLLVPTMLHAALPAIITTGTPLVVKGKMGINPSAQPITYGALVSAASVIELICVRLPLETVLRRGQVAYGFGGPGDIGETTVPVGAYRGVVGTMWSIAREEGWRSGEEEVVVGGKKVGKKGVGRRKRGQGIEGLLRGWRVGIWGLVGVWGANVLGGAGKGGEF